MQKVTITNTSGAAKSLTAFSFAEFCLWNAQDDQTNYQHNLSMGEVEIEADAPDGAAIYHKTEYRESRNHYAVYGVNDWKSLVFMGCLYAGALLIWVIAAITRRRQGMPLEAVAKEIPVE